MRRALASIFVVSFALVACGGKLAPQADGGVSSSSGGASSGGGGGSSGGTCTANAVVSGNRACVPGLARPGTAISIDIDTTEGCLPCFATMQPCSVEVHGRNITVGMRISTCASSDDLGCPAVCAIPAVSCLLPPLAAGTYDVRVLGEGQSAVPRQLVVADSDEAATRCELVRPAPSPGPLKTSEYDRECKVAADCVAVPSLLCRPCACPDTAIAVGAAATYGADYRAASSQCPSSSDPAECAGCAEPVLACVGGQCRIGPN